MGLELAQAWIKVFADGSGLAQDFKGIQQSTGGYLDNLLRSVQGKVMAAVGAVGAGLTTMGMLYKAGQFEQTVIAFETMIGSAEETKKTLEDLTNFAAKTPFEMPEIEAAARGLIQFGERGDELMETLNMLGNAASGTSTPFGFLALVFNQVRGVGKLLTQDFRQLSTRGILSLQDIAKYYGVTTDAAQKMLSEGKVSFEDLKEIFKGLSAEGGRFHNLMEKQSKSLLGLWSTFKDALGITARTLGEQMMPAAKQFVASAIEMVEKVREWVAANKDQIKGYVDTAIAIGKYVLAATAAYAAIKMVGMAITFFTSTTKGAITAVAILKALSGPAGWIQLAAGIGVAVATVHQLNKMMPEITETTGEAAKAQEEAAKAFDKMSAAAEGASDTLSRFKWGDATEAWGENLFAGMETLVQDAEKKVSDVQESLQRAKDFLNSRGGTMGDSMFADAVENLRFWSAELDSAKGRLEAMRTLVEKFGSAKEASSFLQGAKDAGNTPQEDLDEYKKKLDALREIGALTAEEYASAWAKAERESPMQKAVEDLQSLGEELDSIRLKTKGVTDETIAAAKARQQFKAIPGVTQAEIDAFEAMQKEMAQANKELKAMEDGKKLKERFATPAEKAKKELSEMWKLFKSGDISAETYQRGLLDYRKQMQGEPLVGAGRIGFAEFGQQIQDAMLARNDPAKVTAEESKKQTGLLGIIKGELEKIGAKEPAGALI